MSEPASIIPYQFIAIEGNLGAGKTTLSQMVAKDTEARLVLEQFADNPFLPNFYKNPERYAFTVELFFLTERHKQLQQELQQRDLFQQAIVSDYIFFKTLLFARNSLQPEEYRLFQRLFNILNASFPHPDLLVYLHRPVPELLDNIKQRGRSYEQDIQPDYLQRVQDAYFDFFKTQTELPILIVDVSGSDFLRFPDQYAAFVELLRADYQPGVHRRNLLAV